MGFHVFQDHFFDMFNVDHLLLALESVPGSSDLVSRVLKTF
jgi:hypothetical protein